MTTISDSSAVNRVTLQIRLTAPPTLPQPPRIRTPHFQRHGFFFRRLARIGLSRLIVVVHYDRQTRDHHVQDRRCNSTFHPIHINWSTGREAFRAPKHTTRNRRALSFEPERSLDDVGKHARPGERARPIAPQDQAQLPENEPSEQRR